MRGEETAELDMGHRGWGATRPRRRGKEQMYRPKKSPRLKTRKWMAEKRSVCMAGLTGFIDIVMGGNTDCVGGWFQMLRKEMAARLTSVTRKT